VWNVREVLTECHQCIRRFPSLDSPKRRSVRIDWRQLQKEETNAAFYHRNRDHVDRLHYKVEFECVDDLHWICKIEHMATGSSLHLGVGSSESYNRQSLFEVNITDPLCWDGLSIVTYHSKHHESIVPTQRSHDKMHDINSQCDQLQG
jgi:hypothetical protein